MDIRAGKNRISRLGAFDADSALQTIVSRTLVPIRYPSVFNLSIGFQSCSSNTDEPLYLRSRSLIPLTRFCVYCTISENRKVKAEAETSAFRVLLRFLSYIFGRVPVGLGVASAVLIEGADGREKREAVPVGSDEDREEFESTENRGWG